VYLVILVYSQDVSRSFGESGFNHSVFFEGVEDNHSSDIVIRCSLFVGFQVFPKLFYLQSNRFVIELA